VFGERDELGRHQAARLVVLVGEKLLHVGLLLVLHALKEVFGLLLGQVAQNVGGLVGRHVFEDVGGALLLHVADDARLVFGVHLLQSLGGRLVVERLDDLRAVVARERLGEPRDFDGVEARQFVARAFELDGRGVGREVAHVGPVDDLDGAVGADEVVRGQTPPEAGERHVRAGDDPLAARLDELHVVDAHDALAVHVDELLVEHVAREEHLAVAPREAAHVEDV
jgi:hypothetical protein